MASLASGWAPISTTKNPWDTKATKQPDFFGRTPEAAEVFKPISLPKIPGFDPILQSSALEVEGANKRFGDDSARYRSALLAADPEINRFSDQEIGDIDSIFSPAGYEAQMAGIRARRRRAIEGLQSTLFGDLRKSLGLNAIGTGGVAGAGMGSYLMNKAADTSGRLRAQAVADDAEQERQDLAALLALRTGQQGRRALLSDAVASRAIQPTQVEGTILNQTLANRLAALQAALANTQLDYAVDAG